MGKLMIRSVMVLALLFGMVFAVGAGVLYYYDFPVIFALIWAVGIVTLQFLLGPYIIDWIYKIQWILPEEISPQFGEFFRGLCAKRGIPVPKFGIIEDGNPNAFTYGHTPKDARVVVTRGIQQMLTEEEFNAVVAHEIGHITHYDFIVMTFASLAPMLLWLLFRWSRGGRKNEGAAVAVAIGAYVAYVVSQYIVLFLSRVREYFADEHAAESVTSASAISTALIKIAYGLAKIPQEQIKTKDKKAKQPLFNRAQMIGSLGICSFSSGSSMAMTSTTLTGQYSRDRMVAAMQWDLLNPWAKFYELQSTHPLVARRALAASKIARRLGQPSLFQESPAPTRSYWAEFMNDLLFVSLPYYGLIFAVGMLAWNWLHPVSIPMGGYEGHLDKLMANIGLARYGILLMGIGLLVRLSRTFAGNYRKATVVDLVGEVNVSHIHCIPVEVEGQIIGRGVPGLFWSKDLVMQDDTGFMTLVYRQPLGILETLFGAFKADQFVGKKGKFRGWYRRGPSPYLELKDATFETGERFTCRRYEFVWGMAAFLTLLGVALAILL